jgi:hypothetical protein
LKVLIVWKLLRDATKYSYSFATCGGRLRWGGCGPALGPPAEATVRVCSQWFGSR